MKENNVIKLPVGQINSQDFGRIEGLNRLIKDVFSLTDEQAEQLKKQLEIDQNGN